MLFLGCLKKQQQQQLLVRVCKLATHASKTGYIPTLKQTASEPMTWQVFDGQARVYVERMGLIHSVSLH